MVSLLRLFFKMRPKWPAAGPSYNKSRRKLPIYHCQYRRHSSKSIYPSINQLIRVGESRPQALQLRRHVPKTHSTWHVRTTTRGARSSPLLFIKAASSILICPCASYAPFWSRLETRDSRPSNVADTLDTRDL
jgi:hypothetical protein